VGEPGLRSLRFRRQAAEGAAWPRDAAAYHGISVLVDAGGDPAAPPPPAPPAGVPHAIDHVVVQTPDPDRAIALWRDRLGVRLALDREFPKRRLRLLFFRSGGVTLEFSGALGAAGTGSDSLWGLALRVADLAACRARLLDAGVEVSQVRPGQKTGTQVATVRSHDLGVPTLLIQPAG
jgi:catechol 2,3-dioxygenase-like lactoylglutathione lyase family enzyme